MTRLPPSVSTPYAGPVSYSKRCPCVSINSAMPCPTSKAVTHNWPGAGLAGKAVIRGSQLSIPSQRCGQPRGASSHKVPNKAQAKLHHGGAGAVQTANGPLLSHSSSCTSSCMIKCANSSSQPDNGAGNRLADRDKGATTRLTTGIASALATGDTSDTCENSSMVKGTSPTVTTYCVCAPSATSARKRCQRLASGAIDAGVRPTLAYRMWQP